MSKTNTKYTPQHIQNEAFDEDFRVLKVAPLEDADSSMKSPISSLMATRIDEPDASTTYVGVAAIGSAEGSTVWQIKKIAVSGTVTSITWADGNSNFDNSWSNRASLSYS